MSPSTDLQSFNNHDHFYSSTIYLTEQQPLGWVRIGDTTTVVAVAAFYIEHNIRQNIDLDVGVVVAEIILFLYGAAHDLSPRRLSIE